MKAGGGCEIYGVHPKSCKKFQCNWLSEGYGSEFARPDKLGLVIMGKRIKFSLTDPMTLLVFEVRQNAFQEPAAQIAVHTLLSRDIALCVLSPTTTPMYQYHLYRNPAMQAYGEMLVDRNYAVVWYETAAQKGHPSG
jgi:hypothetical protein